MVLCFHKIEHSFYIGRRSQMKMVSTDAVQKQNGNP